MEGVFDGVIDGRLDNGWHLVKAGDKTYEYQSCSGVHYLKGDKVQFIVLDELMRVCEVVACDT